MHIAITFLSEQRENVGTESDCNVEVDRGSYNHHLTDDTSSVVDMCNGYAVTHSATRRERDKSRSHLVIKREIRVGRNRENRVVTGRAVAQRACHL